MKGKPAKTKQKSYTKAKIALLIASCCLLRSTLALRRPKSYLLRGRGRWMGITWETGRDSSLGVIANFHPQNNKAGYYSIPIADPLKLKLLEFRNQEGVKWRTNWAETLYLTNEHCLTKTWDGRHNHLIPTKLLRAESILEEFQKSLISPRDQQGRGGYSAAVIIIEPNGDAIAAAGQGHYQIFKLNRKEPRFFSLGNQAIARAPGSSQYIERPFFMESYDGYYLIGLLTSSGTSNMVSFKINFKSTVGDGYQEAESVQFMDNAGKRISSPNYFVGGIRFNKDSSEEEKVYSGYFYQYNRNEIAAHRINRGSFFVGEMKTVPESELITRSGRGVPGTSLTVFLMTIDFDDTKEWDSKLVKGYLQVNRLIAGLAEGAKDSFEQIYKQNLGNVPYGHEFQIATDFNYVFMGHWKEKKPNFLTGVDVLDLCEAEDEIMVIKSNAQICMKRSALLEEEALKGCEKPLAIFGSCLKCKDSYDLVSKLGPLQKEAPFTKYCTGGCPEGQFRSEKAGECYDCTKTFTNCKTCKNKEKKCLECQTGFFLHSDGQCKTCKDIFPGCLECSTDQETGLGTCKKCSPGQFLDKNGCSNCLEHCASCKSAGTCDTCRSGLEKVEHNGVVKCLVPCGDNKFRKEFDCYSCSHERNPDCIECNQDTLECTKCVNSRWLNPLNKICEDVQCAADQYRTGNTDPKCGDCSKEGNRGCNACKDITGECTGCEAGYEFKQQDKFCMKTCQANEFYEGEDKNSCRSCANDRNGAKCNKCHDESGVCSGCEAGYSLDRDNFCRKVCGDDSYWISQQDNRCEKCSVPNGEFCTECDDGTGLCTACKDQYKINSESKCELDFPCAATKYRMKNSVGTWVCKECRYHKSNHEACLVCDIDTAECSKCSGGYTFKSPTFCQKDCEKGWFWTGKNKNTCKECSKEVKDCLDCSDITHECTKCSDGMEVFNPTLCVPKCEEGSYLKVEKTNNNMEKGVCHLCSSVQASGKKCTKCQRLTGECQECSAGYTLTPEKFCKKTCKVEREYWTGAKDNECRSCSDGCLKCTEEEGKCTECETGFPSTSIRRLQRWSWSLTSP